MASPDAPQPAAIPLDPQAVQARAAAGLNRLGSRGEAVPVLVGFDGFVDAIIDVVDKRHGPDRYDRVPTIEQFGRKILAAAGMSSNYELVVKQEKLGGNGPIMAHALARQGHAVTYLGALGRPDIHPVFADLARGARCLSVVDPARTDALEFHDGKLMLGKMQSLDDIRWDRFEQVVGREALVRVFLDAKLISMVNWTMTPHMTDIWQALAELLESDPRPPHDRPRIFIDLADPEKRTTADVAAALTLITRFARACGVMLGLNHKEANQVADVLGLTPVRDADDTDCMRRLACDIRGKLDLPTVVVHPRHGAAGASLTDNGAVESVWFTGPFVARPKLSTGAGDNFNAGFCTGCLAGLDLAACLCVGVAASGFYVREGRSAALSELADFCRRLPGPEAAG